METKKHVLEIKDLSIIYDTEEGVVEAVNGVNLHLESRHTLGLVGETGAGKTTTALALLRLVPDPPGVIKGGEILINGTNILCNSEKEMERIRGKEIAMVFQDPMTALDPVFTVGEQIAESFLQHEKMSKAKADEKVSQLLEMVGIPASRAHEYPHQSGIPGGKCCSTPQTSPFPFPTRRMSSPNSGRKSKRSYRSATPCPHPTGCPH